MDDNGGDGDGRHEGARAAILAGVDTSPVLKPLEHILDLVPTAVEQDVMRDQHFQVGSAARNQLASQRSEEHTSELQSLMRISYAVFCLKKKNNEDQPSTHAKSKDTHTVHNPTTVYKKEKLQSYIQQ